LRASDLEMFQILARQAALAMENARLYAEQLDYVRKVEDSQKALLQAEKMATAGRLSASIAHEVNNPLQAVQNCLHLAGREDLPPEKRKDFVSNISADAQRLERLVNRLHELARADTTPAHEDRSSALNLAQDIAREFNDEGFEVKAVGDDVLVAVPSDILDSMIRNLIENARQHGAAPVEVSVSAGKTTVNIDVSDAGAGISSGNMTKIFEPFFTTARALGGTGLGLSIVGALADQYGGSLTLIPQERTTFRVVLPVARVVNGQES